MPLAATRIYEMSFFTGFGVSALIYWMLNWAFPARGAAKTFEEVDESESNAFGIEDGESEEDLDRKDPEKDGMRAHVTPAPGV